jgi:hypothetical protein
MVLSKRRRQRPPFASRSRHQRDTQRRDCRAVLGHPIKKLYRIAEKAIAARLLSRGCGRNVASCLIANA